MKPLEPLPVDITIDRVGEIGVVWREWLATEASTINDVDASRVESIDSAGVQLLVSLMRAAREQGGDLILRTPSTTLRKACDAMGTSAWMKLPVVGVTTDRGA